MNDFRTENRCGSKNSQGAPEGGFWIPPSRQNIYLSRYPVRKIAFTNVPLKRTVNVILDRIYKNDVIETKLKKSTLKKLILDCCTKTTFSFNNKLYDQIDGVCKGSSLGPVLANIIMTELEKRILPSFINSGIIKSYIRYVDDTLVMIKESEIQNVLARFNSFDRNHREHLRGW